MGDRELTLDLISTTIDHELFDWLTKTATTAERPDEISAMLAGAVAGLTRYMWALRKDELTPEALADHVRSNVLHFATEARDYDVGGTA